MLIRQLNLDHFGKFHGTELQFQPGINIVYGENESGKSTIHSFIQCMLFGAERLRGRGAGKDTYSRYQPWQGGGSYEGRMRFEYAGRSYRIVRNFHKDDMSFVLIDEQEGRQIPLTGNDISALINGLTLSAYRNSLSIGQLASQPDGQFAASMQSYMANMSMGADGAVDVGKALDYLKEERKKASAGISEEELKKLRDRELELKKEQASMGPLREQQKQLETERDAVLQKIRNLEAQADEAMKMDRKDRMRAIQLIQENNDVTAMYREKRAELRELEDASGNQDHQKRLGDIIDAYEARNSQLEDLDERCSRLEEQSEGNTIRNLALILPAAALTVFVWIGGGLFGLEGAAKTGAAILMAVLTVALAFGLFRASAGKKKKLRLLQEELTQLEQKQQAVLDKFHIKDIRELGARDVYGQNRQENILRLRQELETLRERYNSLQEPLRPYLEKYGESMTLESTVGQEEKKQIEQLRHRQTELTRQIEQIEWRMEQMNARQAERLRIEESIQQMKEKQKEVYEDIMAIDISTGAIKEITAQIHGSFGSQLNDYVSGLFETITDGAHQRLAVDEKFQVSVDDARRLVQPQQLSAGAADQIYFSVRMAVSQMLFDEPMPLILDDSFVMYDDRRLHNTLAWLSEQNAFSQIIIFTCHHREEQALDAMGCAYHVCALSEMDETMQPGR